MGRKNRNGRGRNAGMKGKAKRFASEFLPNEILRDLREDFRPVDRSSSDDGWDDDLNIEVIKVRPRTEQNEKGASKNTGKTVKRNTSADAAGVPVADTSGDHERDNGSFGEKVRLFKKCLIEKPMLFVIGFAFLVIIIWLLVAPEIPGITDQRWGQKPEKEETASSEALVETVSVSRADQKAGSDNLQKEPEKNSSSRIASTETTPAETAQTPIQKSDSETENWKEKIFGSDSGLVQDKQVFITGLSASEKEKLNFRESDFVKAVSAFLSSKRIDAKTIEFLRKMDISADGAQEYLAVLPGHDDFYLVVLMYPEYPGKYILSFLDLDGLAGSLKEKQKQESASETTTVNTPVQTVQTQPVVMNPPVQTPIQTQPQNTAQAEAQYDATNLTIIAVPSTLSNYLDNKYELQYTLYDWLYRNGKQKVSTAAVDDFDIDPDDRVADIIFELDDGSTVYGSYDRDTNSYEYSF